MTSKEKVSKAITKKIIELKYILKEYTDKFTNLNATQISEEILKDKKASLNLDYLRKIVAEYCRQNNIALSNRRREGEVPPEFKDSRVRGADRESTKKEKEPEKPTFEVKDGYVINWSNRTILTDLGEFGTYVASVERHKLIQNAYVHAGEGDTAAKVAMNFNFPHAKSVYQYAKVHGFTKSSIPQTDFELEYLEVDAEKAIQENMQALKLKIYKGTELKKWQETEKAAKMWWNFEYTILESLQALALELKESNTEQLQFIVPETDYKFAAFAGMTDEHYLKSCHNHLGEIVYNRELAKKQIEDHTEQLAKETSRFGRPEMFFLMIGTDNMHVDGIHQSTTRLTKQHETSDGIWRLEFKNYVKIQIEKINHLKQISKVVIIPVKGNHDYETSIAIQSFLEIYYESDPMVEVITCHDPRVYIQYGSICLMVCHGDELKSTKALENKAHMLVMSEAKLQGVNMQEVKYTIVLHGDKHAASTADLGGYLERIGLASLQIGEDWWHKDNAYVGRRPGSETIILDPNFGKKAVIYV